MLQAELYVEEVLAAVGKLVGLQLVGQFHVFQRARRHGAHVEQPLAYHLAVGQQLVVAFVAREVVGVVVLVDDVDSLMLCAVPLHGDVLVHLLHLVVLRLGLHVAEDDAVHDELAVVGRIAEVASVGQVAASVLRVVHHRLVNPVPDGAAAEEVRRLDGVPVVLQVAHGVAHRVGIFRDVERILDAHLSLHGLAHPAHAGILVGAHVDDVVVALILHGARHVEGLQRSITRLEVVAGTGLVAQTPDHDAGVVHSGPRQFHHAGDMCWTPFNGVGERCLAVVVLVALQVGLGLQIDAVFIAEIVEVGVAGVVRRAHVVDVGTLHHHHLFLHLLARDGMSALGVRLVAVHALQLQRLAVHVEVAACQSELVGLSLCVQNLHRAETYLCRHGFRRAALVVLQFSHQHIDLRLLGCPRLHGDAGQQVFGRRGACHEFVLVAVEAVLIEAVLHFVFLGVAREVLHLRIDAECALLA